MAAVDFKHTGTVYGNTLGRDVSVYSLDVFHNPDAGHVSLYPQDHRGGDCHVRLSVPAEPKALRAIAAKLTAIADKVGGE